MKKTSIGIITPNDFIKRLPFGGGSGFILNLVRAMNDRLTIFGAGANGTRLWENNIIDNNVTFIATYPVSIPSKISLRLKALFGYIINRKRILQSDIDVLYVHSPECAMPFLYGNGRKPLVFHQHGSGNPVTTAKFMWARNRLMSWIFDQIHQEIYRRADWIIAIDRLCFEQSTIGGAAEKTSLIMNAVDTNLFRPDNNVRYEMRSSLGIDDNQLIIMFVGRLEEVKQVDLLIKSLTLINKKTLAQLFIAGDGSKGKALQALVEALGLSSIVHFLGQVSHDKLNRYYNLADVLVLPSKMEGVPMVILESLACGTPVVAPSVGGIPDLVWTGKNGILLDRATIENIVSATFGVKQMNIERDEVAATVSKWSSSRVSEQLSEIFFKVSQNIENNSFHRA